MAANKQELCKGSAGWGGAVKGAVKRSGHTRVLENIMLTITRAIRILVDETTERDGELVLRDGVVSAGRTEVPHGEK